MRTHVEVLVIGGGSTGCGVVRDLAMRGVDATLVETGNLTHGTTGRMHGLLHSGGRYAVSDRSSARECIEENIVLRDIATHCIEETGGLFVKRPEDADTYFEDKLRGCEACDIPVEVLSATETCFQLPRPASASQLSRAISTERFRFPTRLSIRFGSVWPTRPTHDAMARGSRHTRK